MNFVEGLDYYVENGLVVWTEHYLRQRGYCCEQGCRHCPYEKNQDDSSERTDQLSKRE